ncbi:MAG TPA: hypothetical protein VLD62_02665 [Acidimicrobiia bacterium]|jgi:hypothetical protein|nr:hypothetical protein [Acidimicrobiia bacterium]
MARLHVEGWAPEYGASIEPFEDLAPTEGSVDLDVEDRPWEPVAAGAADVARVCFVDGVRRVDARLVLDGEGAPVPGIAGSFGVGCVTWDREARRSEITETDIRRLAILAGGRSVRMPDTGSGVTYEVQSIADADPASLVRRFHGAMRRAEADLTERLAGEGKFVIADGPLYETTPAQKIGYIKSHRVSYLNPEAGSIIGALEPGQRTPLFTIKGYERYSWYLRLARAPGGHSWSGIARCEASASMAVGEAALLADRAAALLPVVASQAHRDPRAPQNLVPIAGLERHLRHLLGDPGLVLRRLRAAFVGGVAA